jgi:hypothetical protein
MDAAGAGDDAAVVDDPLAVRAEAVAAALGVPVQADGSTPPTFRFQQALRLVDGLRRRGMLDLAARRFRTTLWAGDHRCLDHLELADLQAVACDPDAGRIVLESGTMRLVLSRQGALTVVPRGESQARAARRRQRGGAAPPA